MELKVKEDSRNYACSVVEIKEVFSIPDADNIARVVVNGNEVVVPKTTRVGDRMLYFVSGTRLSEQFCKNNNLYDKEENNLDTSKRGFISFKQRRVKAIKLKGVVSNGMLMPLSSLFYFLNDVGWLNVGDEFTDINNNNICEKYIIPVKANSQMGGKQLKTNKLKDLILDSQFHFHHETEHFVKHLNKFTKETNIIITRKMHGSSLILSNVLVNKNLSFKEKLFNFFGAKISNYEYGMIWSSGKPKGKLPKGIESSTNKWETPNQSYYTSDIWAKAYKEIGHTVEKGISLYGEIVGEGVQGDLFTYNKKYDIYIYRITQTSVDGNVVEFSWEQLKKYCQKYNLNYVQEYFVGKVKELDENLLEYLQNAYLNKSYPDCKIDEGICIRIRDTDEIFKLKSPNFIKMKSDNQEKEIEENES